MAKDKIEFAAKTQFIDVEGIPVTIGAGDEATPGMYCAAWDTDPPRVFNFDTALRDGAAISQEAFQALIKG